MNNYRKTVDPILIDRIMNGGTVSQEELNVQITAKKELIKEIEELEKEALKVWESKDYQIRCALDNVIMSSRNDLVDRDQVISYINEYVRLSTDN